MIDGAEGEDESEKGKGKITEMGRKAVLAYGLYLGRGFISPKFATDTGVTTQDRALLWEALVNAWEQDRSAARGSMSIRGLYVFTHDNPLGNAPAHVLFDRVRVTLDEAFKGTDRVARSFGDCDVMVDDTDLPAGITLTRIVG